MSLLVPASQACYRLEVQPVRVSDHGSLSVLRGRVVDVRPTAEPPWRLEATFGPDGSSDPAPFVAFWKAVRRWLEDGAEGQGPPLPTSEARP